MIDNKYIIKNFIGIGGSSRVFACTNLEGKSPRISKFSNYWTTVSSKNGYSVMEHFTPSCLLRP